MLVGAIDAASGSGKSLQALLGDPFPAFFADAVAAPLDSSQAASELVDFPSRDLSGASVDLAA